MLRLKYGLMIIALLSAATSFAEGLPIPLERPDNAPVQKAAEPKPAEIAAPVPAPIKKENEAAYNTCLDLLKAQGTHFKPISSIDDANGCGIDKPIEVDYILPNIALKPKATLRCETALQLSRWLKQSVLPAANVAFGAENPITTIHQASSYVCRNRNNAKKGKISEHAKGNAIDIASISFSKGKPFSIKPRAKDSTLTGAFQRTIAASACLYFTTVLDPASDAAHQAHIHMDIAERKNNYRYCW